MQFHGCEAEDCLKILEGEAEVTEENVLDWLDADEGEPGYHHQTEEELAAEISRTSEKLTVESEEE